MPPRVEAGRGLDQADQERRLGDVQIGERLIEEEAAGEPEPMNGAASVLSEIDLVGVGLQDLVLAVAAFEQEGHQRLLELALQGAVGGQIEILDQLLGQGAGAFDHGARLIIAVGGTQDAFRVHPEVAVEVAILDRLECLGQQIGQILAPQQHPILVVGRIDAGDQHGVEPDQRGIRTAVGVLQRGDAVVGELDVEVPARLLAVPEAEGAGPDLEMLALALVGAGLPDIGGGGEVEPFQLGLELIRRQAPRQVEFERARVDPRRQRPALAFELVPHQAVEVSRVERARHADQDRADQRPAEQKCAKAEALAPDGFFPTARGASTIIRSHGSPSPLRRTPVRQVSEWIQARNRLDTVGSRSIFFLRFSRLWSHLRRIVTTGRMPRRQKRRSANRLERNGSCLSDGPAG